MKPTSILLKKLSILLLAFGLLLQVGFAKTTLKVFHYLDRADETATKNFNQILNAFEKKNPDIKLDFDYLVGEAYHTKLQAMNVAGQLPDLMYLWPGKRSSAVTRSGNIKDLRAMIKPYRKKIASAALAPQGPNGELYELPETLTATHVMFANAKLMKKLGIKFPKTFNQLLAQGKKIRKAGLIPIAMDNKDAWEMQSCLLSALVERTAGRKWLEGALAGKNSFSDSEFINALKVVQKLNDEKMFSPGINQAEYGRALTDFVNGKAVYFIDGGWRASAIVKEMSANNHKNVLVKVFPKLNKEKGQKNSTSIVQGSGFGINAKLSSAKTKAAWKWIWFYNGPEGSKIRQKQGLSSAYKLPVKKSINPILKRLNNLVATTKGGYVLDSLLDGAGMGVLQPQVQEMMFGSLTPQQVGDNYEKWVAKNEKARQ